MLLLDLGSFCEAKKIKIVEFSLVELARKNENSTIFISMIRTGSAPQEARKDQLREEHPAAVRAGQSQTTIRTLP